MSPSGLFALHETKTTGFEKEEECMEQNTSGSAVSISTICF